MDSVLSNLSLLLIAGRDVGGHPMLLLSRLINCVDL